MGDRERSIWGWGWADKFGSAAERATLGEQLRGVLGFAGAGLSSPVEASAYRIPPPRLEPGPSIRKFCTTDRLERAARTWGRSYPDIVRGFQGDFSRAPDIVARPQNEDDIAAAMAWCTEVGAALIPYGGGTSVVSGTEADVSDRWSGVLCLDLRRLDKILAVDWVSRSARVQAGILGPALNRGLAEHGLSLRHYPQSWEFSTVGGWIATRAGGHYATLYTHIDDLVQSIRMITPQGPWESARLPGSGAGPSPDRLVLGSEGIFGVITQAWLRVQVKPWWKATASVFFESFEDAVDSVRSLSQSGLHPTNCRLLGPREAALNGVVFDGSTVVVVGFESADHPVSAWMDRALEITADHGGSCPLGPRIVEDRPEDAALSGSVAPGTPDAAGSWRDAFFEAPYLRDRLMSLGIVADTFETATTWDRFSALHADLVRRVRGVMKRECGAGKLTCRFTHVYPDGPAPYYTFLAPATAGREIAQWEAIKAEASDVLSEHGATITHHHAVGRTHRPWYRRQRPEPFGGVLHAIKAEVDPSGIMNPGVLVAERTDS
jgi:alkyldihydroxyacetonephosphate synthase